MGNLTHFNEAGRARMVDVTDKRLTERVAMARGKVFVLPETLEKIHQGRIAKGDVLAVAQVAGVMGAKRTPDLIPMCHPLLLTSVDVDFKEDSQPKHRWTMCHYHRSYGENHREYRGGNGGNDCSIRGGPDYL